MNLRICLVVEVYGSFRESFVFWQVTAAWITLSHQLPELIEFLQTAVLSRFLQAFSSKTSSSVHQRRPLAFAKRQVAGWGSESPVSLELKIPQALNRQSRTTSKMTSCLPSLIGATFLWLTTYGSDISLVFDMRHLQTFEACFCCSRFSSLNLQNGKGPWDLWIHLAKMSNSKGVFSWFSWQIIWDVSIVATPVAQHPWLAWPCCICAAIWAVWHHESRVAGPVPPPPVFFANDHWRIFLLVWKTSLFALFTNGKTYFQKSESLNYSIYHPTATVSDDMASLLT